MWFCRWNEDLQSTERRKLRLAMLCGAKGNIDGSNVAPWQHDVIVITAGMYVSQPARCEDGNVFTRVCLSVYGVWPTFFQASLISSERSCSSGVSLLTRVSQIATAGQIFCTIACRDILTNRDHKQKTRCWSPGSFASAWPELIIACDVRGRGLLQTDRQKDRHHNQVTYCVFRLYRWQTQN